jgi:hypothetical protein
MKLTLISSNLLLNVENLLIFNLLKRDKIEDLDRGLLEIVLILY